MCERAGTYVRETQCGMCDSRCRVVGAPSQAERMLAGRDAWMWICRGISWRSLGSFHERGSRRCVPFGFSKRIRTRVPTLSGVSLRTACVCGRGLCGCVYACTSAVCEVSVVHVYVYKLCHMCMYICTSCAICVMSQEHIHMRE